MGENSIDRFTAYNVGKKKESNFRDKTGRIRNKTVRQLNDQDCAVYLMKSVKKHLSKS